MPTRSASRVVLIVDHDRLQSSLIQKQLTIAGYQTAVTHSGHETIDWLKAHTTDLMVIDTGLSDMSGDELIALLRTQGQCPSFIVNTATCDAHASPGMIEQGAIDCVIRDHSATWMLPWMVKRALAQLDDERHFTRLQSALRHGLEAKHVFRNQLTALHEVSSELMKTNSVDGLCRSAVELGRQRLGFDRLGIWFVNRDGQSARGSYGTTETGDLRDEHDECVPIWKERREILKAPVQADVILQRGVTLRNHKYESVGTGDCAWTTLWDGEKNIGYLSLDNLLSQRPVTDAECEVFRLYGATIGHIFVSKQNEEHVRMFNQELERRVQQRTAEVGRVNKELEAFCYSVSHDLRAPLRAIDGFSEAILDDVESSLSDRARDYFDRIRSASLRMNELIDDLLILSSATRSEMCLQEIDLSTIARAIAHELQRDTRDRDTTFTIRSTPPAAGDPHLVRIAMENLIGNAWKFTKKRAGGQIEFGHLAEEGRSTYFIRDNGAGFDMANVDRLFTAFQRLHTRAEFPGTGIGLATVQRIIHRHGGQIWGKGEVGRGATFCFTLPRPGSNPPSFID